MKSTIWLLVILLLVGLWFSRPVESAVMVSYDPEIYYDYYVGVGGTPYPYGTRQSPIVSVTDLKTVCLASNIKRIHVKGPMTLNSSFDNFVFIGDSPQDAVVNLNNQRTNFSSFHKLVVKGRQLFDSNDIYIHDCAVIQVTELAATIFNSALCGPITLRNNPGDVTFFVNCTGTLQEIGGMPPNAYDLSTYASHAVFRNWSGPLVIKNMNHPSAIVEINGQNNSPITIDSSCVAGTVRLYGDLLITDNHTGTLVVQNYSN